MTRRILRSTTALVSAGAISVLLVATENWAQNNEVNVQFHAFQDARGVTVLSPTVDVAQDVTDRLNVRGSYALDAISAASDSCARCHRNGIDSKRNVGSVSVTRKFDMMRVTAGAPTAWSPSTARRPSSRRRREILATATRPSPAATRSRRTGRPCTRHRR